MAITQSEVNDFCERIVSLEKDKKDIADEIKLSINTFAEAHEFTKKSVSKFIKEWKEANKDKAEFSLVDAESDQLLCIAFPEFAPTEEVA